MNNDYGTFYLISMPIGHPDDLTLRAREVLEKTPLIICEDTRNTMLYLKSQKLLTKQKLIRGDAYKEHEICEYVYHHLTQGENAALVSDCGTPAICDPGAVIVSYLRKKNIHICALPGASALTTFLSLCGYTKSQWHFLGFLPRSTGEQEEYFQKMQENGGLWIAFESPHRILETIKFSAKFFQTYPETLIRIAKELTKKFETYLQGTPQEILSFLEQNPDMIRGEWIIAWECTPQKNSTWHKAALSLAQDLGDKKTANWIATHFGVSKNSVYSYLIEKKKEKDIGISKI